MMLSIELPTDIERRLDALASATGRSKASVACDAIVEHLDDLEDGYLAQQRLNKLRAGEVQPISLDVIASRHGLAD
jgi:RHH-type transcriptional regulator, rel operon repressor / antitoxin RelB